MDRVVSNISAIEIAGKLKTYGIIHKWAGKAIKRGRRVEINAEKRFHF